MNRHYPFVAHRAQHRCEYCHAPEIVFNFPFEVEHIHPRASGGSDDRDNLALGCRSCNLYKSSNTHGYDPQTNELIGLFNPRADRWEHHFSIETDCKITGLTPTARATIETLRINSLGQVTARIQWKRLQLFL